MEEKLIGKITHFFSRISVVVIEVSGEPLKLGDDIHIRGATTDLYMPVGSMQIDNAPVEVTNPGESCGVKVPEPARVGDDVYKVIE